AATRSANWSGRIARPDRSCRASSRGRASSRYYKATGSSAEDRRGGGRNPRRQEAATSWCFLVCALGLTASCRPRRLVLQPHSSRLPCSPQLGKRWHPVLGKHG